MAPYFSEKQQAELHQNRQTLQIRFLRLHYRLQARRYNSERGREFAFHGFSRRLGTLIRAIHQVFTILPPELDSIPTNDEIKDATMAIQAFVFNLEGCIDNLAWIWVSEKPVKATDGSDLNPLSVGLRRSRTRVRESLSTEFREYLEEREPWFDQVKGFRDALAHRIPLYISPYVVKKSDFGELNRLQREADDALQRGDFQDYDRATESQKMLGEFRPWMMHSLTDDSPTIIFHGQLLSDFATIEELGEKMFAELDSLGTSNPPIVTP